SDDSRARQHGARARARGRAGEDHRPEARHAGLRLTHIYELKGEEGMKAWKMGLALMLTAASSAACEANSTTNGNANNATRTAIKNEPAANTNAANTNANPMGALAAPGEGAALYEARNCNVCHGADGKGNAQMKNVPNFTDAAWQRKTTDAEMINVIRNGKPPMPAYTKQLTDEQVKSVIAYIRSLAK